MSSRDMHQPSSIWEMGQLSANSSHATTLPQGSKESIRKTDYKDSITHHSSEKRWKDLSQSSIEASQGNPADIRELATFAQAWRSEPKSTVQHHPYHGGIRKDPHWTARSIVKESGTYSSKTRHAISQAQDFQEAIRAIDFMDSQKAASEKAWRDVSLNSVDRSPSHSTADIRALATLEWQRRKEPQLSVKEDLCDSVTSLDPHGSSSVKKTRQYSVESNHATIKPQNLNQARRATGLGDSQIWRDASQNSLDTRDQHSLSSVTSRLSVDNKMYQSSTPQPSFDSRDQSQARSIHSPRAFTGNSFSLEAIPEVRSGSLKSNFSVESRRQEQSVVACLMGLELLPPDSDIVPPSAGTSSRMGKSLHNLVISTPQAEQAAPASDQARLHKHLSETAQYLKEVSERSHQITLPKAIVTVKSRPRLRPRLRPRSRSSSPAPGQYEEDLHRIGSQHLPQKASNFQQQEENGGQQLPFKQPISPKHLHVEAMPFRKLKEGHHCHLQGLHSGEMDQKLHQLHIKNATQECKTLRQILEAMYLKGLLNHKPVNILREKSSRMQSSKPTFQDTKHLLSSMVASDT
ncbi:hypothetical protein BDL97_05G119900 [Sphagnum fallax]|jgi:hypothetical protein|nr:hypothetical protein BDL97_05G119900 [Sphagnum fallax]